MPVFSMIEPSAVVFILLVGVIAGVVKGAVGFAMPTIMISGLSAFLSPHLALAALIMPTLMANVWQVGRGGFAEGMRAAKGFWRFLVVLVLCIAGGAQLVPYFSDRMVFAILGGSVLVFSLLQLFGFTFTITPARRPVADVVLGAISGVIGGISGIWGPSTVLYLTALNTPKAEQIRLTGMIFGVGSVVLLIAHLKSGILNLQTLPLSVLMAVPAFVGVWMGNKVQDRLDQRVFRRITLVVLILGGLNLLRRALVG